MQLTIEVFPAPFGPMMENSSPSLTPKDTSVSARTPPKRSDTPRTSKACSTRSLRRLSAVRTPGSTGPVKPANHRRRSDLQPFLADGGVGLEIGRRAFEHDAAVTHYVEPVRDAHGDRQFLLNQQDGDAAPRDLRDQI